jgi:hypothetical protein
VDGAGCTRRKEEDAGKTFGSHGVLERAVKS